MVKAVFILLFFTGVVSPADSVPCKYYLILQNKTWFEAQNYCQANHSDLVTIENADTMIQLQTEAQKHQFSSTVWIGLYRDWFWSYKNKQLDRIRLGLWASGEPNGLTEECGVISPWGYGNYPCSGQLAPLTYVCFDDSATGNNRFIYYSTAVFWPQAQSYCRQHHTDLATINTSAERAYVMSLISTWTWFGLFRNLWKWSDNKNLSVPWLNPGQPTYAHGETHCAYLQGCVKNVPAIDGLCSKKMPFFCYGVITGQKQSMRMKLQSDVDVNEPTVSAVILQQIQQKLKDKGMENVKVKFRKRPDGDVFRKLESNDNK